MSYQANGSLTPLTLSHSLTPLTLSPLSPLSLSLTLSPLSLSLTLSPLSPLSPSQKEEPPRLPGAALSFYRINGSVGLSLNHHFCEHNMLA